MLQLLQQQFYQVLSSALITTIMILLLRPIAYKISLVDRPDARKHHQNITPLIGGICIYLACGLSLFAFGDVGEADLRVLVIAASLFLLLGVLDDQFNLKSNSKLLFQIMISSVFLVSSGLQISNLGTPFGLAHPFELGFLSMPFTLLVIVGLTNAFNLIDGCDGLAACLAVLAILVLLFLGPSQLQLATQNILLLLVASIAAFLFFNFSNNPALKVFLGDGGSLFLGFVISVLLIKFSEGNETYSPSIVLWFVAVPIYDLSAVVARRILLKREIFSADRGHIHHILLSYGFSHFQTTLIILFAATLLLGLGIFLEVRHPSLSLFAFIGLFAVYLPLRMLDRET